MGNAELPQPYTTEEIERRPWAVVVSLLIGLLLCAVGWNIKSGREYRAEIARLHDSAEAERDRRIEMYEHMIFLKNEKERLEARDSVMREQTGPFVHKILKKK